MARYGMEYDGGYGGMGHGPRFQGGRDRNRESGGMRSDGGGPNNWRDFPGEEGWYGGNRGYDEGYRGGRNDYGSDRGGMRGGGYGGREMGYGGGRESGAPVWEQYARQGRQRGSMRAAELMTEDPECVTPDATLQDVARTMKQMDVGIIPVVDSHESKKLRGVITDRDIAIRAFGEGKDGKMKVSECMTDSVETVNKNDPIHRVLQLMKREQVRRVPVTDREGRLVGIIAQADLATEYANRSHQKDHMVSDMVERVSEPARPRN